MFRFCHIHYTLLWLEHQYLHDACKIPVTSDATDANVTIIKEHFLTVKSMVTLRVYKASDEKFEKLAAAFATTIPAVWAEVSYTGFNFITGVEASTARVRCVLRR